MGRKNGKAKPTHSGSLFTLPPIEGREQLLEVLDEVAPGAGALVIAALRHGTRECRSAAIYLVADLRTIAEAAAAALDGRDVRLTADDMSQLDAPDRAIELALLVRLEEEDAASPGVQAARDAIGSRLETVIRSLRDDQRAEARA